MGSDDPMRPRLGRVAEGVEDCSASFELTLLEEGLDSERLNKNKEACK